MSISSVAYGREAGSVYRKVGLRLLPLLLACYVCATVDRFNIGFAKLQFLQDLGLNDAAYGTAAGLFYVGYVLFEVPSNLWLARVGLRRTLLRIMLLWGGVTCLLAFATGASSLYALRFLLGVAEAGFFPGVLFYLTLWFPDRLRGRVTSLFVMAMPAGGVVSGPLAGLVMERLQGTLGLHGWQWLFLLEGAATMSLAAVAFFHLSDSVEAAGWLTAREREAVALDVARGRDGRVGHAGGFGAALKDRRVYLLAFVYFGYFCSLNSLLVWAPSLLKAVPGQTLRTVGLISGALAVLSTVGMVAIGASSDRFRERHWHVALCGLAASAAFALLPLAAGSIVPTVALLGIASVGIFAILSLFWTIPSAYLDRSAAAGGIALISAVGSSGGAFSPVIIGWVKVETGSLYVGLDAVAVLTATAMVALLLFAPRAPRGAGHVDAKGEMP